MNSSNPSATPNWLRWVYQHHGSDVSLGDATLLYRGGMSWEDHHALCVAGDLTALLAHLEIEDHPSEREVFYIGSFNMTCHDYPEVAIEIGRRYIEEFSRDPFPFDASRKPDELVLAKLARLYADDRESEDAAEVAHRLDLAIWVCQIALHFGLTYDGTKTGFAGRLARLQEARKQIIIP